MVDLQRIERFHRRFHTLPQIEAGIVRGDAATPWGVLCQLAREVAARRDGIRQRLVQAEDADFDARGARAEGRRVRAKALAQASIEHVEAARQLAEEVLAMGQIAEALSSAFVDLDAARMAELDELEMEGRLILRGYHTALLGNGRPDIEVLHRALRLPQARRDSAMQVLTGGGPDGALRARAQALIDALDAIPSADPVSRDASLRALEGEAARIGASLPALELAG